MLGIIAIIAAIVIMTRRSQLSPERVLLAYYDSIDFKRFADSYNYLDTTLTLEEYLRWLSLRGGIVASFAKLDNMFPQFETIDATHLKVNVTTEWVTSLGTYTQYETQEMVLTGLGWRIVLNAEPPPLPRETTLAAPQIDWFQNLPLGTLDKLELSRGVFDRSLISTSKARLYYLPQMPIGFKPTGPDATRKGRWEGLLTVVGEVTNRDALPVHVTVTAILRDAKGNRLAQMNAMDMLRHELLPGESSPYRIDFFGAEATELLDPFSVKAVEVIVQGVPIASNLDRSLVLLNDHTIHNSGAKTVDIPRVFKIWRTPSGDVRWVNGQYLELSVSPGRVLSFTAPADIPPDLLEIAVPISVDGPRLAPWQSQGQGATPPALIVYGYIR